MLKTRRASFNFFPCVAKVMDFFPSFFAYLASFLPDDSRDFFFTPSPREVLVHHSLLSFSGMGPQNF